MRHQPTSAAGNSIFHCACILDVGILDHMCLSKYFKQIALAETGHVQVDALVPFFQSMP